MLSSEASWLVSVQNHMPLQTVLLPLNCSIYCSRICLVWAILYSMMLALLWNSKWHKINNQLMFTVKCDFLCNILSLDTVFLVCNTNISVTLVLPSIHRHPLVCLRHCSIQIYLVNSSSQNYHHWLFLPFFIHFILFTLLTEGEAYRVGQKVSLVIIAITLFTIDQLA